MAAEVFLHVAQPLLSQFPPSILHLRSYKAVGGGSIADLSLLFCHHRATQWDAG